MTIPRWPEKSLYGIHKLFNEVQKVDVFVEDASSEVFYDHLFRFGVFQGMGICRSFGLSGRASVIEKAKVHQWEQGRAALFIIDGDLYLLLGRRPPPIRGLHCHDAYCIENLLICPTAIQRLLAEELGVSLEKCRERFDFGFWESTVKNNLARLFAAFALAFEADLGRQTIKQGVSPYYYYNQDRRHHDWDQDAIDREVEAILAQAEAVLGFEAANARFQAISQNILAHPNVLNCFSGKDFLLPVLERELSRVKVTVKRGPLLMRLAAGVHPRRFARLRSAIRRAVQRANKSRAVVKAASLSKSARSLNRSP